MKRHVYEVKAFPKEHLPDYDCPSCGSHLALEESDYYDSAFTIGSRAQNDCHDVDCEAGVFHMRLKCNKPSCQESVVVVGRTSLREEHVEGPKGWELEYETYYHPEYFIPHLRMFAIPPNTPNSVMESIEASFNLFFVSTGSALNEVRNALEFLMDHLQIDREGTNNSGKKYRLSLDARVNLMQAPYEHYKELLLAVKWLGNYGTHAETTRRSDVLDAYEMLHYVLNGMFSGEADRVKGLADGVLSKERAKKAGAAPGTV